MDNLPQRGNEVYTSIEKFKDYELTECIAYEMAIRTEIVKTYLQLIKEDKTSDLYEIEEKILNECWLDYEDIHLKHYEKYNITDKMIANTKTFLVKVSDNNNDEISIIENNSQIRHSYKTTSRPKLKIPKEFRNDITLNVNFNLPSKEIIQYIKMLKDFNDKKFSIGISNKMINMDKLIKYTKPQLKGKGKSDTIQKKWADLFYIYDCYKIQKEITNDSDENIFGCIDLKLLEYYKIDSKPGDNYYSVDLYKKNIMKPMKFFIDKYNYKKLLVGNIS